MGLVGVMGQLAPGPVKIDLCRAEIVSVLIHVSSLK